MLLSQLEQREQQAEQQKKAYTYAASYEDFIKLISTSADVNFLKQLRHDTDHTHTLIWSHFYLPQIFSKTDIFPLCLSGLFYKYLRLHDTKTNAQTSVPDFMAVINHLQEPFEYAQ